MDIAIWIVEIAACIGVLWWMLHAEKRKWKKLDAEVRERPFISAPEFYSRYFQCADVPQDVAIRVRAVFARFTGIAAENILPDDDFHRYTLDNAHNLISALEKEFGLTIPDSTAIKMRSTVRSVAMEMSALAQHSHQD